MLYIKCFKCSLFILQDSMASSSQNMKCSCNYRCVHSSHGYRMVSRSTFFEHRNHDLHGNVHPSILQARANETTPTQEVDMTHANIPMRTKRMWCSCQAFCHGGKSVAPNTWRKHQNMANILNSFGCEVGLLHQDASMPESNYARSNAPDSQECEDENVSMENAPMDNVSIDETLPTIGNTIEESLDNRAHLLPSLCSQIIQKIIDMQTLWDEYQMPISAQDRMLGLLFGDMGGGRVGSRDSEHQGPSLSKLLVQLPETWNGVLAEGFRVPACWDQLNSMFLGLGMVSPKRYRICMGEENNPHDVEFFLPSDEDNYTGNVLPCICGEIVARKKAKRDCLTCCEKCQQCNKPRKDTLAFDYLPVGKQIQLLVKSQAFCHDMLMMWRQRERWLGRDASFQPDFIHDFWDGAKCREVQEFWNPSCFFELPVTCSTLGCNQIYPTFPRSTLPKELKDGWNEEAQEYKFVCKKCRKQSMAKRQVCKVDTLLPSLCHYFAKFHLFLKHI